MIPRCVMSEPEASFDVKIEEIEKLLDKNYKESGSADKAVKRLKKILDGLKEE